MGSMKRICEKCGASRPTYNHKYCDPCKIETSCSFSKYSRQRYQKNSLKIRSRVATRYAEVVGKLDIIYECRCKNKDKFNHHFDYDRPREVIRLCRKCHTAEHYRLKTL